MKAETLMYYAKIQRLMVNVESMKVDNLVRERQGYSPAWSSDHFDSICIKLMEIENKLAELVEYES